MPWLELRIHCTPEQASPLETALLGRGALSVTLQDNADQPIFEPELGETPLWEETRITGLFDATVDANAIESALNLPGSTHRHWHILEDKDWEREWMQHYHPIQCGKTLWICPSWQSPPDPEATNLLLDPGLAFGTGTHPTTFLCLEWLADIDMHHQKVIDYGCGSGILGIAALLLGAEAVVGVDIDPQALLATQENTRRNHLSTDRFPVFFPNKCPNDSYDLVLANILAGPLVELYPTLDKLTADSGTICLSGLLTTQADTIIETYSASFDFEPMRTREEWACLIARKRKQN